MILSWFKTKQLGSKLRVTIKKDSVIVKFDGTDEHTTTLSLEQITEKFNTFFGVRFFKSEYISKLDDIPLDKEKEIQDADDLDAKEQSTLEFLCELIFDSGEDDDINLTKEHHHSIRKQVVHKELDGLVSELRNIAQQFLNNQTSSETAFGVIKTHKNNAANRSNKMAKMLAEKNILEIVKDIIKSVEAGSTKKETIETINALEKTEELNTINFPQLQNSEAETYRTKIQNLKNFFLLVEEANEKEIAVVLNTLAKTKKIQNFILKTSHKSNIFKTLSPRELAIFFNNTYQFTAKEEKANVIEGIIYMGLKELGEMAGYADNSLKTAIIEGVFREEESVMKSSYLFKILFPWLSQGAKENLDAESLFLYLSQKVFEQNLEYITSFVKRISAKDPSKKYIKYFLGHLYKIEISDSKRQQVADVIKKLIS
jgi:hypothetical protein